MGKNMISTQFLVLVTVIFLCQYNKNTNATEYFQTDKCVGINGIVECTIYSDNIANKSKYWSLVIKPQVTITYKNELNTIRNRHFVEWTGLTELIVEYCHMPQFTDQVKGLSTLKVLSFKNCKVQTLSAKAISDLWALREIDLSFNEITQIPEDFFKRNTYLNLINLSYNQISRICELINHIDYLDHLLFQGNLLHELPFDCFDDFPTFEMIQIGGNKLKINSYDNLFTKRGFWGLYFLDLRQSCLAEDLRHFNMSLFPTLQYLYLSDNKLTSIPVEQFKLLEHMTELDLSNNRLIEIPHEALSTMKKLKKLFLMNNPIFKIDVEKIISNKPTLWVMNMFRIMCNTMQFSVIDKFQKMGVKIEYYETTWCRSDDSWNDCESTIISHPTSANTHTVISEVQIGTKYDYGEWWTNRLNGITCYDDCGHNFRIFNGSYDVMEQITSITVLYQFDKFKKQMLKYLKDTKREMKDMELIEEKLLNMYKYFNTTTLFTQGYL